MPLPCFPCLGRIEVEEEDEDDDDDNVEQPTRVHHQSEVITANPKSAMPSDATQSKSKAKTYGKKKSKFPVVSKIFANQDSTENATPTGNSTSDEGRPTPRDPLAEITETFSNIQINVPVVESPSAWIDPDEAVEESKSRSSRKSKKSAVSAADKSSLRSNPHIVKENSREEELQISKTNSLSRSQRSLVPRGSSVDKTSPTSNLHAVVQEEEDGLQLRPRPHKSHVSKASSIDHSSVNSKKKQESKDYKPDIPRAESPASRKSQRSIISRVSKADKSSVADVILEDTEDEYKFRETKEVVGHQRRQRTSSDDSSLASASLTKAKGKAREVFQEEQRAESPTRSLRSFASRRSSARKSSRNEGRSSGKGKEVLRSTDHEEFSALEGSSKLIDLTQTPKTPRPKRSTSIDPKTLLTPRPALDPSIPAWLQPLAEAYNSGPRSSTMTIQKWSAILGDVDSITKIAEASFAEVYRVQVANETSILKVVTLKPPKGPGSQRFTAMTVPEVLSEFQVMDVMSDLDGFLELKDAYLVEGKPYEMASPHTQFRRSKEEADPNIEWYFPHPLSYQKETMFLVMEMADAGQDLGSFEISGFVQIFDIFLQIAIALDAGERYFEFEHRDLHENNVCLRRRRGDPEKKDEGKIGDRYKLNCSGFEATILDFTLSRAKIGDDKVAWYDLESDPNLFLGEGLLQYQVYRDMRTHLYSTTSEPSWSQHIPYTNVLWLKFILYNMLQQYHDSGNAAQVEKVVRSQGGWRWEEWQMRVVEINGLQAAFGRGDISNNNESQVDEGGIFSCVGDVVEWAVERGWINSEDRL